MHGNRSTAIVVAVALGVAAPAFAQPDAETAAREVLDAYFEAWNAADNDAVAAASNFPRISIGGNGQVVVREDADAIAIDFDLLRRAEGWDHTTLDLVETLQVSDEKVHFKVIASRRRADGVAYRTIPALYIITRQDGHWGLQLQSMLPPTFTAP